MKKLVYIRVLTEENVPVGEARSLDEAIGILWEVYTKDQGRLVITVRLTKCGYKPSIVWDKNTGEVIRFED